MKILTRTVYDGGTTKFLHREIVTTKRWSVSWHPHTAACRYGYYSNWRCMKSGGLAVQLNIPLIGDFSLWGHWQPL